MIDGCDEGAPEVLQGLNLLRTSHDVDGFDVELAGILDQHLSKC
jgi:hypothetical protein